MRNRYKVVLKAHFHQYLIDAKAKNEFSQEEMATRLAMDTRSFADLKSGKFSCSVLTLVLFLIYCCDNQAEFLDELKEKFEEEKKKM